MLYLALLPSGWLLAQASAGDPWVDSLLKGGPFAVVLLLIIMDKIGTHGERDRLRKENDELRAEIRDANKTMREEIVPPAIEMTKQTSRIIEILSDEERFPSRRQRRAGA